jgi:hypothetical protein
MRDEMKEMREMREKRQKERKENKMINVQGEEDTGPKNDQDMMNLM